MTPTSIVAYLLLFTGGAFVFLFVALLLGWLLRARKPSAVKLASYECGEPAVGSSYVQFDLRFYVVALVFLIFDVEVAFFFPWAVVFGKSNQLAAVTAAVQTASPQATGVLEGSIAEKQVALGLPMTVQHGTAPGELATTAHRLAWAAMLDMAVFFVVLLVGFAYVWNQGDLDWVRAIDSQEAPATATTPPQSSLVG
jgi:NADH-quinone oxidoreductase subunit A